MEDQAYRRADGSCIISEDVIATIASSAATEVPGVAGTVAIMVVSTAITVLAEHINTGLMVVRHQRSIDSRIVIRPFATDHCQ